MIVHTIDGVTWETVYAHMRSGSRTVKEGDYVTQGQTIGVMGNTGILVVNTCILNCIKGLGTSIRVML